MAIKLLFQAMDSNLYKSHPRLKIMLMSLCNFAGETGQGKMWNATMARHIGTGEEQVRRYKRKLENDGVVSFNYKRGKGRFTSFQIDLVHLDRLINRTDGFDELELNLTPPTGGVTEGVTPPLTEVTPPTDPQTPTSEGGVKRERTLERGDADGDCRIILDESLTAYWRKTLIKHFGEPWLKSWLTDEQITQTPHGVLLIVKNAFGKSKVQSAVETLTGGDTLTVMVSRKASKARA